MENLSIKDVFGLGAVKVDRDENGSLSLRSGEKCFADFHKNEASAMYACHAINSHDKMKDQIRKLTISLSKYDSAIYGIEDLRYQLESLLAFANGVSNKISGEE